MKGAALPLHPNILRTHGPLHVDLSRSHSLPGLPQFDALGAPNVLVVGMAMAVAQGDMHRMSM